MVSNFDSLTLQLIVEQQMKTNTIGLNSNLTFRRSVEDTNDTS